MRYRGFIIFSNNCDIMIGQFNFSINYSTVLMILIAIKFPNTFSYKYKILLSSGFQRSKPYVFLFKELLLTAICMHVPTS